MEHRCNKRTAHDHNNHIQKFTVFVPTNDAIKDYLGVENDFNAGREFDNWHCKDLEDFVLINVVEGREYDKRDLRKRCSDSLRMANNENTRTICEKRNNNEDRIYQKGPGNSDRNKPQIRKFDIDACDGIIHEINKVMLPAADGW